MKKFISMVMAAAMVVSLVPATAFAAEPSAKVTGKVVESVEKTVDEAKASLAISGPELQLVVTDVDAKVNGTDTFDVTLKFDGADVTALGAVNVYRINPTTGKYTAVDTTPGVFVSGTPAVDTDKDTIEFTLKETTNWDIAKGDMITIALNGAFQKAKVGAATVAVKGELGAVEAMTFASVVGKGIKAELNDDVVVVAEDETVVLEDIVVNPTAGANFDAVCDGDDEITLKLSKGFEFVANTTANIAEFPWYLISEVTPGLGYDDATYKTTMGGLLAVNEFTLNGLEIAATTAKPGDVCYLTIRVEGLDSVKLEVAKVIDYKVVMELADADEDVPVIYSGVNANNDGITDDSTHESLEVVIKETFAGAWSNHKDWTLTLPEGVYVTNVVATDETKTDTWGGDAQVQADFVAAYREGDHEFFEFNKRTFPETHTTGNAHEISFVMTLVAEPGFVGDVVLTMEGAALDTQEVTIAKFVAPFTVEAAQNDVIIDYRYTEVPTEIVITEAEAGLWDAAAATRAAFQFTVERGDMIQFEDEAVYTVNEESEMEIDDTTGVALLGARTLAFEVEEESDEEAAVVTISGIELFMQRNIPAGPYDLTIGTSMGEWFLAQPLFAATHTGCANPLASGHSGECIVDNVDDVETTVKEAWINVITAGRDKDDASFTKKVVVPVGEAYLIAGEDTVPLEVPAYINADGYTMLPVRAVATALGINNNNVIWSQAAKQVTILYGQRIITMTAGEAVVYVNASSIPASAAVEIVNGRAFLPLRDLANALGVTEIGWDAATSTATLN